MNDIIQLRNLPAFVCGVWVACLVAGFKVAQAVFWFFFGNDSI